MKHNTKQEVQSKGKRMIYPIILRKEGTGHQKLKLISPQAPSEVQDKVSSKIYLKVPFCSSYTDVEAKVGFLRQGNLTGAIFQKRIFGMGKYDKVITNRANDTRKGSEITWMAAERSNILAKKVILRIIAFGLENTIMVT